MYETSIVICSLVRLWFLEVSDPEIKIWVVAGIDQSPLLSSALTVAVPKLINKLYVTENVAGPSRQAETLRAAAVEQEIHRSDRTVNLKLTKNQTLQRRGWLIPLTVVAVIIVVVYFIYNQLR